MTFYHILTFFIISAPKHYVKLMKKQFQQIQIYKYISSLNFTIFDRNVVVENFTWKRIAVRIHWIDHWGRLVVLKHAWCTIAINIAVITWINIGKERFWELNLVFPWFLLYSRCLLYFQCPSNQTLQANTSNKSEF